MEITTSLLHLNSPMSTRPSLCPMSTRPSLCNYQGGVFLQRSYCWFRAKPRTKPICASVMKAEAGVQKEDIVIVGAGIAGLATAVSLRRSDKKKRII